MATSSFTCCRRWLMVCLLIPTTITAFLPLATPPSVVSSRAQHHKAAAVNALGLEPVDRPQWLVALSPGGGRGGKKGGGSILDKPAVQIAAPKVAKPKAKEDVKSEARSQASHSEKYAVMLYGDDDYEQGHVVTVLCKVIQGFGVDKAVAVFEEAQRKGRAIVMIADKESASLVSEKISRNKPIIITDIEPMAKGL